MPETCTVRRTKYGKVAYVTEAGPDGTVRRLGEAGTPLAPELVEKVIEHTQRYAFAGRWEVLGEDGQVKASFGSDPDPRPQLGPPLVELKGPPGGDPSVCPAAGEECNVATSDPAGPFVELHELLAIGK